MRVAVVVVPHLLEAGCMLAAEVLHGIAVLLSRRRVPSCRGMVVERQSRRVESVANRVCTSKWAETKHLHFNNNGAGRRAMQGHIDTSPSRCLPLAPRHAHLMRTRCSRAR